MYTANTMAAAIEAGIPKMRIEESAARIQARIDSGRQIVIGVNRYQLEQEEEIDVLRVDNAQVRSDQISRLEKLKSERDTEKCLEQLEALTRCAETGEGNLLALAVNAARAHATVGEISEAIEKAFGRHIAEVRTISGVFSSEAGDEAAVQEARNQVVEFESLHGRQPRI